MKREWKTAEDLDKEVAADPVVSQRLKERDARMEERIRESLAALEPTVRKAQALGFTGDTLEEILRKNAPLPRSLVNALLSSLSPLGGLGLREQEMLIRVLGAAQYPFDGAVLVEIFERTDDYALQWAIANTFALTKPTGIEQWLKRIKGTSWERTFAELT